MKKVTFFVAMLAFMGLSSMNVNAQSGKAGTLSWRISGDTLIISGSGAIPHYSNYTSNSAPWYPYRNSISTVIIGDGVNAIGNSAFYSLTNLTSVTIPNSVTRFGNYAFFECFNLISVTIPNSAIIIGDNVFKSCGSLTTVNFNADSCISIGKDCWSLCGLLTTINIGTNVKWISDITFNGCNSLTSINVSDSNCRYSSNNEILYNKLQDILIRCPARKTGTVIIPNTVTSIGNYAFQYCILTSITIPNSVTNIGNYAFYNCSATSIIISNSVKSIGDYAFSHCYYITSIIIPDSVTSIGNYTFQASPRLTSITIPNGVTNIGDYAFSLCNGLTSITIPNSVTNIGKYAFQYCSLTSITIPDYVITIGNYAFQNCIFLDTVNFNAINCGAYAPVFSGDTAIKVLNIGNQVTTIPTYAFYNCSGLISITIPSSVTSIGHSAFSGCSKLTSITVNAITPPKLNYNTFGNIPINIPVYIPCLTYNSYHTADGWKDFANFVVNGHVDSTFYTVTQCYGTTYTDDNFTTPINSSGVYYTTLSNNTNCDSVIVLDITFTNLPVRQELCMVSVDENYHNEIVWKQTDTVISYNIYRDGESGTYDLIATVDYNSPNRWVDSASNAMTRSYCYRIAGIDTCGNESELSVIHKTMCLTINAGQNNSWNLSWTPYEGVVYSEYNIYRASHDAPNNMELIYTMPDGNTSYTDFSAPEGYVYYRVEVVVNNPCVLTKSLSSIKSNIASNNPSIGIADMKAQGKASLHIFPNPTTGQLRIERGEWAMESVEVFDMMGRKQYVEMREGDGVVLLNISHLSAGMYLVKAGNMTGKVVKE